MIIEPEQKIVKLPTSLPRTMYWINNQILEFWFDVVSPRGWIVIEPLR